MPVLVELNAARNSLRRIGLAVLALGLTAAPAFAQAATDLDAFIAAYHCPVYTAMESIRARPMTPLDRFIVLAVDRNQRYVQCQFMDDDKVLYCEASSGFYGKTRMRFAKGGLAAIAALGFDTNVPDGNFWQGRPVRDSTDVWSTASLLLETLYRGYGARLKTKIEMHAALLPKTILKPGDRTCVPTS